MARRRLIVDLTAPRSVIVDMETCECGVPFAAVERSKLRPVRIQSHLTRERAVFALHCSCGSVSIVFEGGQGELALVPDDFVRGVDADGMH